MGDWVRDAAELDRRLGRTVAEPPIEVTPDRTQDSTSPAPDPDGLLDRLPSIYGMSRAGDRGGRDSGTIAPAQAVECTMHKYGVADETIWPAFSSWSPNFARHGWGAAPHATPLEDVLSLVKQVREAGLKSVHEFSLPDASQPGKSEREAGIRIDHESVRDGVVSVTAWLPQRAVTDPSARSFRYGPSLLGACIHDWWLREKLSEYDTNLCARYCPDLYNQPSGRFASPKFEWRDPPQSDTKKETVAKQEPVAAAEPTRVVGSNAAGTVTICSLD